MAKLKEKYSMEELANLVGDKKNEGIFLGNLGGGYSLLGEYEKAIQHQKRAIDIAKEIGDKRSDGAYLGNLGDTLLKMERWEEAEQFLCEAIEICKAAIPPAAGAWCSSRGGSRSARGGRSVRAPATATLQAAARPAARRRSPRWPGASSCRSTMVAAIPAGGKRRERLRTRVWCSCGGACRVRGGGEPAYLPR